MSGGLRADLGEDARSIEAAVASLVVTLGAGAGMALFHVEFGLVRLPFGLDWVWFVLGGVVLLQAARIPRLSWPRGGAAFGAAVGVALLAVGIGPVVACPQGGGACVPRLFPSPVVLVAGVALTAGGTYLDLLLGRPGGGETGDGG